MMSLRTLLILSAPMLIMGCHSSGMAIQEDTTSTEVSVGYGTQDSETVTGAITHIDAEEELHSRMITRVEQMLARVPGVSLRQTADGGFRVLIRGATSVNSSNDPLYVVDGIPVQVSSGQGLYWLDPMEIKSIDVLKDAGAAAIYGSRGAAGVVIIKTRRR